MAEGLPERLRSFIAIPLPAELQREIAELQQQLRRAVPELKPVRAENLHLTLNFLGEQSQDQLAKVAAIVLSIGEKKNIFNVVLKGLGCFPNRRRARVLWIGIEPEGELTELYNQLAAKLVAEKIEFDQRPFRPHLTIGRFKRNPQHPDSLCPFLSHRCGNLTIDSIILFSSRLTGQGAIHTALQRVQLLGAEH